MDTQDKLRQAQELAYDAMESTDLKTRITLAKKALKTSDLCADAYVILAHETKSPEAKLELLKSGVKAGQVAIGPDDFEENIGIFWGILETRPYMRARAALAEELWQHGEFEEAISHLTDMLRLNPNDNQGVRYPLLTWLLSQGDIVTAEAIITEYDELSAHCRYANVVLQFLKTGPSRETKIALNDAIECNMHVPAALLNEPTSHRDPIDYYARSSPEEAILYIEENIDLWETTDGLLDWLKEQTSTHN